MYGCIYSIYLFIFPFFVPGSIDYRRQFILNSWYFFKISKLVSLVNQLVVSDICLVVCLKCLFQFCGAFLKHPVCTINVKVKFHAYSINLYVTRARIQWRPSFVFFKTRHKTTRNSNKRQATAITYPAIFVEF